MEKFGDRKGIICKIRDYLAKEINHSHESSEFKRVSRQWIFSNCIHKVRSRPGTIRAHLIAEECK